MSGYVDIFIEQNTDFSEVYTWAQQNGSPNDITGYAAEMKIRNDWSDIDWGIDPILSFTNNDAISLGASAGTVALNIPAAETLSLFDGVYVYDLVLINPLGKRHRFIEGKVIVSPQVSN